MPGTFTYRQGTGAAYTTITSMDTDASSWSHNMNVVENGNNFTSGRKQGSNIVEFDTGTGEHYMDWDVGAGSEVNLQAEELSFWFLYTGKASDVLGANSNSFRLRVYSDVTAGTNWAEWELGGHETAGLYAKIIKEWNPFLISGENPTLTNGTTPNYQSIRHVRFVFDIANSNTSNNPDMAMDWLKHGDRIRVTGGTSGSPADMSSLGDWSAAVSALPEYGLVFQRDIYFDMWAGFEVGDGSTATYFAIENEVFYNYQFSSAVSHDIEVLNSATFRVGKKDTGTDDTYAINGALLVCPSTLRDLTTGSRYSDIRIKGNATKASAGALLGYASKFYRWHTIEIGDTNGTNDSELIECDFDSNESVVLKDANLTITNCKFHDPSGSGYVGEIHNAPSSVEGMQVFNCVRGFQFKATMEISNYVATDNSDSDIVLDSGVTLTLVNSTFDKDKIRMASGTGTVLEKYTWTDQDSAKPPLIADATTGSGLSGFSIHVWDGAATPVKVVNGLTTDSNGQIAQQKLQNASHSVTGTTTTTTDTSQHTMLAADYGKQFVYLPQAINAESEPTFFSDDNDNISESNQTTVNAYTGFAISHVSDTVTSTSGTCDRTTRLYDRLQSVCESGPQGYAIAEIMPTVDGANYQMLYDWVVDNTAWDGESKNLAFASGKELTIQGASGNVSNLSITSGDVNLNVRTDVSNFNVAGDVDLSVGGAGEYNVTDSNWGSVTSTTSGVIINLLGSSTTPTNNSPTNIIINVSVPLKVKVIDKDTGLALPDARVRLMLDSDKSQLLNGDCDVNGEISGSYSGSTPANAVGWAREMNISTPDYHQEDFAGVINAGTGLDLVVALRPITE